MADHQATHDTSASGAKSEVFLVMPGDGQFDHEFSIAEDLSALNTAEVYRKDSDHNDAVLQSLPSHLHLGTTPEKIHILISTKSGTGKAEQVFEDIIKPLLDAVGLKGTYNEFRTTSHQSIKEFASGPLLDQAQKGHAQTIFLLSGDGGIVDIVNGLLAAGPLGSEHYVRPTIALIPLGTGNALFHSLQQSPPQASPKTDLGTALRVAFRGTPHPLPIFRARFSAGARLLSDEARTETPISLNTLYGAVVASYGFHATLVADSDTEEWRKHGDKRFGMVAGSLLSPPGGSDPHAYKAKVTVKRNSGQTEVIQHAVAGADPEDKHVYILLSMVSNLEKTFKISPSSKPLDGKMRLVHFGPMPGSDIVKIMTLAYDGGKHITGNEKLVGYEDVDSLRIDFQEDGEDGKWRRVCIDGSIVKIEEGGWIEVDRMPENESAINVLGYPNSRE